MRFPYPIPLATLWLVTGGATAAFGQVPVESTGTRALGMGGAFVAVADDSSASWWNPAGLPGVGIFGASLDVGPLESEGRGSGQARDTPAWRVEATRIGVATPVLAFSYERLRFAGIPDRVAGSGAGRTLHAQHFGVTLVQSLTDNVVVGTTLRLVRAGLGADSVSLDAPAREAVRRVAQADVHARNRFDADVGLMTWAGRLRLGLVVRNLAAPTIAVDGIEPWRFDRQARVGASIGGEPARGVRNWALAVDADLTTTTLPDGRRRSVAGGGERWWAGRRFAVRAGGRIQTVDDLRPAISSGLSVAARSGLLIEAHGTRGTDGGDRSWGIGARLTF